MHLAGVTFRNFRCFGDDPVTISFQAGTTALIGSNASGKTAVLEGLARLFAPSRAMRTIRIADFHTPPNFDPTARSERSLAIDAIIALPELIGNGTVTAETVAPTFQHMVIEAADTMPCCRLRLEAQWSDDGTLDGEITQRLSWVETTEPDPDPLQMHGVSPADRGLIQLLYTPATRNPASQVRASADVLAARLLRAVEWSDETEEAISEASATIVAAFEAEPAIEAISAALTRRWTALHDAVVDTNPRITLTLQQFAQIVAQTSVAFADGPGGVGRDVADLSDGQQSLLYFALVAAVFDLERQVVADAVAGFRPDSLSIPALTILAVEEPENHLSPYYLSRINAQLRSMTGDGNEGAASGRAQAVLTSHAPASLSRVPPEAIRHCRHDPATRLSRVVPIAMPGDVTEAAKFVRGALLAHPELYFARFVLLVEGDSERIVLPQLADALDLDMDPSFVAVVPLGGRHVQHFWRLLEGLGVPFATLLDLDLGRAGGGFGRIKTALKELQRVGIADENLLAREDGRQLTTEELNALHEKPYAGNRDELLYWLKRLRTFSVYFSSPLDIDYALLKAFPDAYASVIPPGGGPRGNEDSARAAVLGTHGETDIYDRSGERLRQYRYHFLTRSKPATHLAAFAYLADVEFADSIPSTYKKLITYIVDTIAAR